MSQHCKDALEPTELIPFFDWFEHVPGELRQSNRRNAGSCHELCIHLPAAFRPLLGVIGYAEMKAWTVTGLCHDMLPPCIVLSHPVRNSWRCHAFMLPVAIPAAICFRKNGNRITIGRTESVEPRIISG